ncbi:MAG: hypothetical protein M0R06_00995 [Sphaerochaeta sp.]|jgi:hypothetical protein|nr:hypothetical protein [Sphaerochaeta sp.]
MTLNEFLTQAQAGALKIRWGDKEGQRLVEGYRIIDTNDVESLVAEAYNQDALGEEVPWEDGIKMVSGALGKTKL